jgi:uncharacterized membrane protein YhaH (DUF805 family)
MIDQDTLKRIEDLHRLKNEGVITEDEFERSKEKLLFGGRPARPANSIAAAAGIIGSGKPDGLPNEQDHIGWITLPLRRYADFEGRSTRREFWMFQLAYVALVAVVSLAFAVPDSDGTFRALVIIAAGIAALGLLVPLLAVEARRFHDQNRSGWLVLINFVPYVGVVIVYIMMLIEGSSGENRFGPNPKAS